MEELNNTIEKFSASLSASYAKIAEKGGAMPEHKNSNSLADAIRTIPNTSDPGYDPDNPTLAGLKAAVNAGDYETFPVGTEIPDTYNGNDNPLIVAQYLDSTNNSAYGGAEGVIV